MATLEPFRATRFDPSRTTDLSKLVCPPYDVISDADREELYGRDPNNVVRIISGKTEPTDNTEQNRHTRAAGFFKSWVWEGILQTDDEPAIYIYRQTFTDPLGQRRQVCGVLGLIDLDDEILAHENTMAGPRADRRALMEALPVNVSPIYSLVASDRPILQGLIDQTQESELTADFTDEDDVRHTIWRCLDTSFIDAAKKKLEPCPILIADGHHRFAMSCEFRDAHPEIPNAQKVLSFIVDANSADLCVLPYHRIVTNATTNEITRTLSENFDIEDLGAIDDTTAHQQALSLYDHSSPSRLIAFAEGRAMRLTTKRPTTEPVPATVLNELALKPLGITSAEQSLSFTPRAQEVADAVATDKAVAGFCLSPIEAKTIWQLATQSVKMPEKSTYFFPKPKDGIVMRSLTLE